ncbi:phage tail protein I [Escherichia coli]
MTSQSVLPPNAITPERALEVVLSHVGDLPGDIRIIKNPDLCPANLLPWLAWEYAVTYWNPDWSEQQNAKLLKQLRGRISTAERVELLNERY